MFKTLRLIYIFMSLILMSGSVFATSGVTYHGRILRSNSDPVNGQFVGFRLRVMDGDSGTCQMYEEIQTKDMRTSNGVFALVIGDGSVVGTYGVTGVTFFDELFKNNTTYNFAVGHPCNGTPYNAQIRDGRKLNVSFRESPADPWEDMPVMNIEHVPFAYSALNSQKVGNHGDGSLLRVENAGTPSAVGALTPTQYNNLVTLSNGTSTQYVQSVLGTASQITVNTVAGVATVGLADVATAGTYGSATQVPVFTLDAKGRITSVTNTTITGAAPTGAAGGDLTGNFPNPDIAALAVGTAEIAANAVTDTKLANDSVITAKILDANVTLNKLAADSVNSAKIVDGSITGSDISSTANLSVASVTATGAVSSDSVSTRSIGLFELPANGTNYVAMKAPDNLAGNTTYTWPAAAPGSNMILQSDNAGNLSWVADATGAAPGDASYAAKGIVQFDTDAATSGISVASGIAKLATSGVAANTYGTTAAKTVSVTVDAFGRITSASEQDIALNASAITAGILPIARGGTNSGTALNNNRIMVSSGGAIVEAAALTNGQLLIGSTGAAPVAATLTAGTGVTINNTAGGIEISAAGSGGTITALTGDVTASGTGSVTATIPNDTVTFAKFQNITDQRILGRSAGSAGDMQELTIGTGLDLTAGVLTATATAPGDASYAAKGVVQFDTNAATSGITVASGVAKLANSGVTANTYGAADKVPVIAVDAFGRITSAVDTNIALAASAITSGILDVARGGTGTGTLTANRMFIANGTGTALVADSCTVGQVLQYNGTTWTCLASTSLGPANAYVQSGNAFGATAVLGTTDNNSLQFITNNTAKVTVLADGNVGIGTTAANLGGTSSSAGRTYVNISGTNAAGILQLSTTQADGNNNQGAIEWVDLATANADKRIGYINVYKNSATANNRGTFMAFATKLDNGTGASERMRVTEAGDLCVGCTSAGGRVDIKGSTADSTANGLLVRDSAGTGLLTVRNDGKVGIGTTAPSEKLDVKGNIAISGSTSGAVKFAVPAVAGSATYTWPAAAPASNMVLQSDNTGTLSWVAAATGSGDVKSDGSVAMTGTLTSSAYVNYSGTFTGADSNSAGVSLATYGTNGAFINGNHNTSAFAGDFLRATMASASGSFTGKFINFQKNNVAQMTVDASGNAYFAGNVGVGTSTPGSKLDVKGDIAISGSTSGAVKFAVPAVAGSATYTWPAAAPASNMVLQSDNTGTLSWVAPGGSGDFKADGTVPMTGAFRSIGGTNSAPGMTFVGDTDTGFYSGSADTINIAAGGTALGFFSSTSLTLTDYAAVTQITKSSINVSAGTSAGSVTLFNGGAANSGTVLGILNFRGSAGSGSGVVQGVATETHTIGAKGTAIAFQTTANGGTTTNEKMRIDHNGNVGIGTTGPSAKLDVKGDFAISGSTSGSVKFAVPAAAGSATYTWPAAAPGSNMVLQSDSSGVLSWVSAGGSGDFMKDGSVAMTGPFKAASGSAAAPSITFNATQNTGLYSGGAGLINFSLNGSERLAMDANGMYGTAATGVPYMMLNAGGSAGSPAYSFYGDQDVGMFRATTNELAFSTAGSERLRVDASGNVGIGMTSGGEKLEVSGNVKATSFISTSDRRLKTDIRDIEGLELIRKLNGVRYKWKSDGKDDFGLIAQEVEEVIPEAVVTDKNGYKAVKYSNLVSPLIEATKDLDRMCRASEEQLKRVQAQVEKHDRQIASVMEENKKLNAQVKSLKEQNASFEQRLQLLEKKLLQGK